MTIFISEEEQAARRDAAKSGKQENFETAWATVTKATPGPIVRLVNVGKVHVRSLGRDLVLERGDLPALRAAIALLEGDK
jgi:hypothetical protein